MKMEAVTAEMKMEAVTADIEEAVKGTKIREGQKNFFFYFSSVWID